MTVVSEIVNAILNFLKRLNFKLFSLFQCSCSVSMIIEKLY